MIVCAQKYLKRGISTAAHTSFCYAKLAKLYHSEGTEFHFAITSFHPYLGHHPSA